MDIRYRAASAGLPAGLAPPLAAPAAGPFERYTCVPTDTDRKTGKVSTDKSVERYSGVKRA